MYIIVRNYASLISTSGKQPNTFVLNLISVDYREFRIFYLLNTNARLFSIFLLVKTSFQKPISALKPRFLDESHYFC